MQLMRLRTVPLLWRNEPRRDSGWRGRRGKARRGVAGIGMERQARQGRARSDAAWRGAAGMARLGEVRKGEVWAGMERQARRGLAPLGWDRNGRHGMDGEATQG